MDDRIRFQIYQENGKKIVSKADVFLMKSSASYLQTKELLLSVNNRSANKKMENKIRYEYGNDLDLDDVIELLKDSTLGARRPIDDRSIVEDMIRYGNLTVTAWDGNVLVGLSRTLTDFNYCGYLSDLAVRLSYQKMGIGTEMIRKTREKMGSRSMLILLAAPAAVDYYPRIGFTKFDSAWILRATDSFPSTQI